MLSWRMLWKIEKESDQLLASSRSKKEYAENSDDFFFFAKSMYNACAIAILRVRIIDDCP